MSYTNLYVPSNSDSDTDDGIGTPGKYGGENAEAFNKVNQAINKPESLLASVPEHNLDDDEGDDDVFVDVENTVSWSTQINKQNISFCGLDERAESCSDLTTKSDEDVSVQNNLDLNSNNSATDISANDLSSVRSDDEKECDGFEQNNSETGDIKENVTLVEISIVNDSCVSSVSTPVKTPGSSADAPFELQSNSSGTGISVQTDVSTLTKSDENLCVDNEQEFQSTGSDTGVSLNNLSSARSDENASVQSDPEIGASLKSDDSKASLAVNVSRSIQSEDSFGVDNHSDNDVILLLEDRKACVAMDGRPSDALEEKTSLEAESEFDVERCKGSISLIMKTREIIDQTTCGDESSGDPLFQLESNSDGSSIKDVSDISANENIEEKLNSESEKASNLKAEKNENMSDAAKETVDEKLKIESAASVHLRTEEFKRDEAKNHPQKSEKKDDRDIENVQFTWDFSTSTAIKDLSLGETEKTLDGKAEPDMKNDGKASVRENDPPSDAGTDVEEKTENDPNVPVSDAPKTHAMLKIVDSPPELTTKSLDILSSDSENQDIPEELHNSKSFGIPNKKSSKNRSACSLVKHNNSVEIIRTKNEDDDPETDGDADEDEDDGIGYGFANKSSSSLGKHRDSVELLCGKRFDSGSSMQVQKLSFLNNAVEDEQDENGAAYQSRSGLLKIRDSVEVIGMGNDDMEIGDVSFESSSHHSPRSILKINKPRSKENAISNTRLVSWKDTTVETELENNFPDDSKQAEFEFSVDNKRGESLQTVEVAAEKTEVGALLTGAKKKPAKKPPRPKVGNLIKLFSSSKKIAFDTTDSDSATPRNDTMENVESEALNEVCKEADTDEIKKTFTFWKKVCDSSVEEKAEDTFKASENNGNKVNFELKNLKIEIVEKAEQILIESKGSDSDSKSSDGSATVPKKPHKFVEKFEKTSMVPNPLFKNFPLPVDNVFVKDRVSVLERSANVKQDGGNVKSDEGKHMTNP